MSRLRRLRRWWPVIPIVALALLVYAALPGRWTYTVSPETTYVTGPLDAQGYVDYPTALNERLGKGVDPDNNANVLIWKALGPRPEGGNGMPPEYFRWLGIDPPPEQGEYFLGSDEYFQAHLAGKAGAAPAGTGEDDPPGPKKQWDDRLARARSWPWQAADEPDIADWLRRNERPLAVLIEASKRPRYFHPRVSKLTSVGEPRLLSSLLPTLKKCRAAGLALVCRGMSREAAGDDDGAWQDLLACQRLGRVIAAGGGSLVEGFVGMELIDAASAAELALLGRGRHSSQRVLGWLADSRALPPLVPLADVLEPGERFLMLDMLTNVASFGGQNLDPARGFVRATPRGSGFWDTLFTRNIDWDPALRRANAVFDRCVAAARQPDRRIAGQEFAQVGGEVELARLVAEGMSPLEKFMLGKGEVGEAIGIRVIALALPAIDKVRDAWDRTEQTQRNLQVAFALAAYRADAGRYPARLAELAPKYLPEVPGDLFSG
ncbi:MAG: hypothetical protein J2P46_14405, partial [Zavarzinella sp.]|nr:hypothetical protein [Zavarzinella sp.]